MTKPLTVITSFPPLDEKEPPSMLRELSTLSEKESSSWSLAECLTKSYDVTLVPRSAAWDPLNSPGLVLLSPKPNESACDVVGLNSPAIENRDTTQALTMTLSQSNFSDAGGPPPAFLWTSSGIDMLMSREASGLDGILGPHEDTEPDQGDSDVVVDFDNAFEAPPAPPNTMIQDDMDTSYEGQEEVEEHREEEPREEEQLRDEAPRVRPLRAAAVGQRLLQEVVVADTRPKRNAASVRKRQQPQQFMQAKQTAPISKRRRRVQQSRGAHVKNRPEMQVKAREGQRHWGEMVQQLRAEWQERKMWEHDAQFREQIAMCSRSHIKSQHECLLRQLQIAHVDGMITAAGFSGSEEDSFLGWTGFQVVPGQHKEFRAKIEGLFATVPKDNTLNNSFRRAGLVPKQCWSEAWAGTAPFKYDGCKRAVYSQQN